LTAHIELDHPEHSQTPETLNIEATDDDFSCTIENLDVETIEDPDTDFFVKWND